MSLRNILLSAAAAILVSTAPFSFASAQDTRIDIPEILSLLPEYELDTEAYETEAERLEIIAAIEEANAHNASLSPQTGIIELKGANVEMDMGDSFYFLEPKDAMKVLVDLWGNPANSELLGMIFERGTDGYSNEYAVAVYYEPTGYISDEDAASIDYSDLLKDMKKQTRQESQARRDQGYAGMELIGWGADPSYNAAKHSISWAQLLKFDETEENTLNYNMRFLGRKGVLEFRYIANEEALPVLEATMPAMADMAVFNVGYKYSDFNPATDKVATYGLAGLVAGGAVAKKLGLVGFLILFLKKGWIVIIAALAFGRRFTTGLFKSKKATAE